MNGKYIIIIVGIMILIVSSTILFNDNKKSNTSTAIKDDNTTPTGILTITPLTLRSTPQEIVNLISVYDVKCFIVNDGTLTKNRVEFIADANNFSKDSIINIENKNDEILNKINGGRRTLTFILIPFYQRNLEISFNYNGNKQNTILEIPECISSSGGSNEDSLFNTNPTPTNQEIPEFPWIGAPILAIFILMIMKNKKINK